MQTLVRAGREAGMSAPRVTMPGMDTGIILFATEIGAPNLRSARPGPLWAGPRRLAYRLTSPVFIRPATEACQWRSGTRRSKRF
jgi:hypothetical protein